MSLAIRMIGDLSVSAVGLGCVNMSIPETVDERERSIATVQRALDVGITLFDTSNVYAPTWDAVGHNEAIIGEAIRTYRGPADLSRVVIATKGGMTRSEGEIWGRDVTPDGLRRACEDSLRRLGLPVIDVYQLHRHDPSMTFADQMRALKSLKDGGLVRRLGLSNAVVSEMEVALDILGGPADSGLVSVQNEYSPMFRGDPDVLERCTELRIAFLPWSPLGGVNNAHKIGSRYAPFTEVAAEIGASPQETVIAWLLALSPVLIALPGGSRPSTAESIALASSLALTPAQVARLSATEPDPVTSGWPEMDLPRSPLR